jgi:hypothetical protein
MISSSLCTAVPWKVSPSTTDLRRSCWKSLLELVVSVRRDDSAKSLSKIRIAWNKPPNKRKREILLLSTPPDQAMGKPIRSDARIRLT